jgi:hypothetical protein
MLNVRLSVLALAGLSALVVSSSHATTLHEDFSSDPAARGWKTFGNTNLMQWDSTNQNLRVTWDSSQPNSYFYLPLGTVLAREDDFTFAFDLRLSDASTGDTTGPMQVAVGLLNLADATDPSFQRAAGVSPNVAEFDYYPLGYFPGFPPSPPTATPGFVDSTSSAFAPEFFNPYYDLELPTNVVMHIAMSFTASNQTAVVEVSTNGVMLAQLPSLVLNNSTNSMFADTNDYRLTMFAIASYSEAGGYESSILAHGVVDNVVVTVPPPPVQNLSGAFSNNVWQVQFASRTNWLYTLRRATDYQSWTDVSPATPGVNGTLVLSDSNPPAAKAFYRVRANRP